jgi:hypothetical protein
MRVRTHMLAAKIKMHLKIEPKTAENNLPIVKFEYLKKLNFINR